LKKWSLPPCGRGGRREAVRMMAVSSQTSSARRIGWRSERRHSASLPLSTSHAHPKNPANQFRNSRNSPKPSKRVYRETYSKITETPATHLPIS
jgi:hypothetical protein